MMGTMLLAKNIDKVNDFFNTMLSPGENQATRKTLTAKMKAAGVEFNQEPVERFGTVDAGFRDPSGNGWKMIESRD